MPRQERSKDARTGATEHTGFVGAARTVASFTLLSRFAGVARDALCSRVFGTSPIFSAFAFALLLPNLFRRLFGEGALAAAFVPEYAQLSKKDPEFADRFASAMLLLLMVGLGIITLLGEAVLWSILHWSSISENGALALRLAMVALPFMPLVCSTAIVGGILQTNNRFAPTAAAPIIVNLCMIATLVIVRFILGRSFEDSIFAIAGSVVVAGVLQLGWSLFELRRYVHFQRNFSGTSAALSRVLKRMLPVIVGLGALQINTLLDGLLASWPILVGSTITLPFFGTLDYPMDEGSNAVLYFAQRLYQFPLGVFGIAIATAVFPALAKTADEPELFRTTLRRGIRLSLFIGLPASIGLIFAREPLAGVILGGREFDADDVHRVGLVLLGYAPAIWAYVLTHTLTRAFYAQGDTKTPVRISLFTVAANITLNLILIWKLGVAGLAWSTSLCASVQALVLLRALKHKLGTDVIDTVTRTSIRRHLVGIGIMAVALFAVSVVLGRALRTESWGAQMLSLAALVIAGSATYAFITWKLGAEELTWLLEKNVRRDAAKHTKRDADL